jgi:ABC-type transporter Mla subunit MlaD
MEEFNQAEGSSGDSFSGDGAETMTEDIDRSILRMSDILDDVCDNMGRHEQVMTKTNETVEVLKKRVAAAITLANGAAQTVRELNPATQESVDSLAASIGTIVSENEGFAEKTLKSISNMKKAVAILATVLLCTMFALIVVAVR